MKGDLGGCWARWLLALALLAVGICAAIDWRLKTRPFTYDAPPAAWHAGLSDVPGFLEAVQNHPDSARAAEELDALVHEFSVDFRIAMGIRPTPARWGRWFGSTMQAWGDGGDWAFRVRPGVLARAADAYCGEDAGGGTRKLGKAFYAWRDESLVVSTSEAYLVSSLARLGEGPLPPATDGDALIWWPGSNLDGAPGVSTISIHAPADDAENWRFDGDLNAPPPTSTPQSAPPLGADPLLTITGGTLRGWAQLVAESPLRHTVAVAPPGIRAEWNALHADWAVPDEGLAYLLETPNVSAALLDVDTRGTLPVPVFALAYPLDENASPPFPPEEERLPHMWDGTEGYLWPFLGTACLFATARTGTHLLVTSQEPAMGPLLSAQDEESPEAGRAWTLDVDLQALSEKALQISRRFVELELYSETNTEDLDKSIQPILKAVGAMGRLHVEIPTGADALKIRGVFLTGNAQQ